MSLYDSESTANTIRQVVAEKEDFLKQKYDSISASIEDVHLKRCLDFNHEKGAGAWLTALPLKDHMT